MRITVAAAQFRSTRDPDQNAELVAGWAARAAEAGVDLLVCPEATMANFSMKVSEVAQPLDGPFATRLRQIAAEHCVWLVAGMFEPAPDGRVFNTVLATDGGHLHRYRKRHLYDAFGAKESDHIAPGDELVTFEALGTTIGLATCYDVRFATQFIDLRRAGAEVICLPASWSDGPAKDEQWNLLARSRAMDSQSIIIAADQSGDPDRCADPAQRTRAPLGIGQSLIVGPMGQVLARAGLDDQLVISEVDLDLVAAARRTIPMDPSQ